ncbi:FAD-dependent oxidoreductase [Luteolibacter sp. SL250]|uniref:FAD-dependent oxidoreductase n=1 Tax=Luteolibacter sp. SL250 TaxID=2995170 RepID=UPI00226FE0AE|nr:FAD-dependent oxidoreductase [Luteolibacter sp. SL250]WAC21659.1 FAD-dependent oxidoreductase [Luteolibacter sp. SL250]
MRQTIPILLFSTCLSPAADVVIYGATPGGIASAISAAKSGSTVTVVEPGNRIGGLVTSGLSHTDFHSFESLSGSFADFASRVEAHYIKTYGKDSQQVKDCFRGTFAEPKVNLLVLEQMLAEQKGITIFKGSHLSGVTVKDGRIVSASFSSGDYTTTHDGKVFIDATYEGDLMAKAGVAFHVGREGRAEFNESLAPEQGDKQLQAYNFRLIMTPDPANRVPAPKPPGYRREDFVELLPALESGKIRKLFDYPKECIFKAQTPPLPNNKYDINDVSGGFIRLSLPGKNAGWPEGTREERKAIFAEHLRDQVGMIYFLQNDDSVPAKFRDEARSWGFCKDEFTDNGHLPPELYVREARRMMGVHVFSQKDSERPANDPRAPLFTDTIAMGDYGNNCHGTFHEGPRFGGKHTGEFYNPVPPYQIPYGVLLPKTINNLLVPVAVSSTHVGFCALRLEPIWMSLGQAAGYAASLAAKDGTDVQKVPVQAIQKLLIADKSALTYFSDLPLDSPHFAAVQWWAAKGGFHGVEPWGKTLRGKKIHGQYNEAAPAHEAKVDEPLTPELRERWISLAKSNGIDVAQASSAATRGDFIRAIHP